MNESSEQAPGRFLDNIGERDVFIFVLKNGQIISLEADINFLGSKHEAVYLEQDMFLMQ